jgi:hypothetical protein
MGDQNINMLVNSAYHAATISGLMMSNSWIMKKFLKMKPANLSQLDAEDIAKLSFSVFSATIIRDWLIKQGVIPNNIMT